MTFKTYLEHKDTGERRYYASAGHREAAHRRMKHSPDRWKNPDRKQIKTTKTP